MSYDEWKQRTPPAGKGFSMSEKCKCGKKKNLCDSFCPDCKKEWQLKFNIKPKN